MASRRDLVTAALLPRANPAETLVSKDSLSLADLSRGAIVGTCSRRRTAQLLRHRPDLRIVPIRGDEPTRIAQVRHGPLDATILALAGLERLGLAHEATEVFDFDRFLPEAGQGAIANQTRGDDWRTTPWAVRADDPATRLAIDAERAFAHLIEEHPGLTAAARATWSTSGGRLRARVLAKGGRVILDAARSAHDPHALATELAASIHWPQPLAPTTAGAHA